MIQAIFWRTLPSVSDATVRGRHRAMTDGRCFENHNELDRKQEGITRRTDMKSARWLAGIAAFTIALTIFASAATALDDKMTPIAIPAQPNAIQLKTGTLPGAMAPESWHRQYERMFARNVTVATLTPFLPDPAKASGAAVIVAPGGGFRTLSMENEGWDVARALADKGVAAFVLKYRLVQTPPDLAGFERVMTEMFSGAARPATNKNPAVQYAPQIADARAAFALVRSRSKEWHVDADRIGMVGFSAGAMLTLATTLYGQDAKPAFIGELYGPLAPVTVPADAPPLFIALAADDPSSGIPVSA